MTRAVRRTAAAFALLVGACAPGHARRGPPVPPPPTSAELARELPLDARARTFRLANGLTVYLLPHRKPRGRASLRLAVDAGSVLEDDDQQGLAHFIEHMGFNGTTRFPKHALIDFIERSGLRFGPDLNAYTTFDETVYKLEVPTDPPELLERGVSVLRDWATGMTFSPEEIERERGVVLEEWRTRMDAAGRILEKQVATRFHGSTYAHRLPIGKSEIIANAPREALVRFYEDWYRPDLMAVVATGDFDPAALERIARAELDTIPARRNARARPVPHLPTHAEILTSVATDPELTTTSVEIAAMLPRRPERSGHDFRRALVERMHDAMLSQRLDARRREPTAPFLDAFSTTSPSMVREIDAFRVDARVTEDGVLDGFTALVEESARVDRHGFTESELVRAKQNMLKAARERALRYEDIDARELADTLVTSFLRRKSYAGPELELDWTRRLLPTITLAELDQVGARLAKVNPVISIAGPATMPRPAPAALFAARDAVATTYLEPYDDGPEAGPLLSHAPVAGHAVYERELPGAGVTELRLSNGVRVVLKPTSFARGEVLLAGFSPGGTSTVPDEDWDTARFVERIAAQGGLGPFDSAKLRKLLAGKVASVSLHVDELEETIEGRSSASDIETLFQLVRLGFDPPRRSTDAFTAWRKRAYEMAKQRSLSPELTFADAWRSFRVQDHLRRRPTTAEAIARVDLDRALSIYRDRFSDAGDFTFVIVGDLDMPRTRRLVETYLASLPATGRNESYRDLGIAFRPGASRMTVAKGTEPKSRVELTFHGLTPWSRAAADDLRTLDGVFGRRLREVLREEMGDVYDVAVSSAFWRRPVDEFALVVQFGCAPDRVDDLVRAVFDEARALKAEVPPELVSKERAIRRRSFDTNIKDNAFWLRELAQAYRHGDTPEAILDIDATLSRIEPNIVREAARKYLDDRECLVGVLVPEGAR